jgi:S1-C subfamily serine protease
MGSSSIRCGTSAYRLAWFIFSLLLFIGHAYGQTWEQVSKARGNEYFLDRSSITRDGDVLRAWIRITYSPPKYNERKAASYTEELQRIAVRCSEQSYALTSYSERANAVVVESYTYERRGWTFDEYAPGTVGASLIREVCASSHQTTSVAPALRRMTTRSTAARWQSMGTVEGEDGTTLWELDRRSITKQQSGFITALLRMTPTRGRANGKPYQYSLTEIYFDCDSSKWALSAYIYLSTTDAVVMQEDIPGKEMEWKDANTGSVLHNIVRDVCGRQQASRPQETPKPSSSSKSGFGTGWFVEGGYVITAYHVVDGATRVSIVLKNHRRIPARILTVDAANDIAILDVDFGADLPLALPVAKSTAALGARVFTLGFPHPDVLGVSPKLTAGEVSATAGLLDDPRVMQISVPVQSGNSGGPLLSATGEVVGVVSAKLSASNMLRRTGDLTQNVNYAIKGRYVSGLLSDVPARTVPIVGVGPNADFEALVARVRDSVFIVMAE